MIKKERSRIRFFRKLSVLLGAVLAVHITGHAQTVEPKPTRVETEQTIRIESNLVTLPVVVTDHQGRNIIDLEKEDFLVLENGVEQEISLFDSVNEPVTILLLLDVSGSMGYRLQDLADAANVFVSRLRPNDSLIAATFADNVSVLFGPKRVASLEKKVKIRSHYGSSSTMLFDAVDTALRKMRKIKGRKAIVLFSDGIGDGKFTSVEKNLRLAEEGETIVYTVQFKTVFTEPADEKEKMRQQKILDDADSYMQDLARITGGRAFQLDDIPNLHKAFAYVADELSKQYRIGYYSTNKSIRGQRIGIRVRVRAPGFSVRARNSYVIGETKSQ